MIEIMKKKAEFGDSFEIITAEGAFEITFAGNLDLYWKYNYTGSMFETDDYKDFFITKENYFLYSLFDNLYNRIKNYDVFYLSEVDNPEFYLEMKQCLIENNFHNPKRLFKDDKVEWHCDDFPYDEASMFTIEKGNECYKLTFHKSKNKTFISYIVRLRNSGSRYDPFHILFMDMYLQLCSYEPTYHQVHMEEYLYQQNLVKKKEKK